MRFAGPVILTLVALLAESNASVPVEPIVVGAFSKASLAGWVQRSFKGETTYQFVSDSMKKSTVLQADSNAAASGRFRKIKVDLTKTPILNWSWKVANTFDGIDENVKAGDDFPARIYVVVERGVLGFGSLSVNYVWASQHPVESNWPSPFSKQVRLIAVDSGVGNLNKWASRKRNVRIDLRNSFGEDIVSLDAVALMTDTDNSGRQARAYYGDIWFSAE